MRYAGIRNDRDAKKLNSSKLHFSRAPPLIPNMKIPQEVSHIKRGDSDISYGYMAEENIDTDL